MIASARPTVRTSACHAVNRSRPRLREDSHSHQPHPERLTGGLPEDDEVADRDHHRREREKRLGEPVGAHAAHHRADEAGGAADDRSRGDHRERVDDERDAAARHAGERPRRVASRSAEARVETARGLTCAAHDLVGEAGGLRPQRSAHLRARQHALERLLHRLAREHAIDHRLRLEGWPAWSRACAPARRRRRARGRPAPRPDAGPAVGPAPPAAGSTSVRSAARLTSGVARSSAAAASSGPRQTRAATRAE